MFLLTPQAKERLANLFGVKDLELLNRRDLEVYLLKQQDVINGLMLELARYAPSSKAFKDLTDERIKELYKLARVRRDFFRNIIRSIAWLLLRLVK